MKGAQIPLFPVGTLIEYTVAGIPKQGHIVKLYASGTSGAAKIKPTDGSPVFTRRLRNVWRPTNASGEGRNPAAIDVP
jgi:hypothetical protein